MQGTDNVGATKTDCSGEPNDNMRQNMHDKAQASPISCHNNKKGTMEDVTGQILFGEEYHYASRHFEVSQELMRCLENG